AASPRSRGPGRWCRECSRFLLRIRPLPHRGFQLDVIGLSAQRRRQRRRRRDGECTVIGRQCTPRRPTSIEGDPMAYILDTAQLPAGARVEAVYAAMMDASAPCHVIHEDPTGPVYARMGVWDLGAANIFTHRSSGIRLLRTPKQARQDAM